MQSCHLFNYRLFQYTFELFSRFCYQATKQTEYLITTCSLCRKRAESEARKGSLPNNKEMPLHHPTDPVELRRLNFQTPGRFNPHKGCCLPFVRTNASIHFTKMRNRSHAFRIHSHSESVEYPPLHAHFAPADLKKKCYLTRKKVFVASVALEKQMSIRGAGAYRRNGGS